MKICHSMIYKLTMIYQHALLMARYWPAIRKIEVWRVQSCWNWRTNAIFGDISRGSDLSSTHSADTVRTETGRNYTYKIREPYQLIQLIRSAEDPGLKWAVTHEYYSCSQYCGFHFVVRTVPQHLDMLKSMWHNFQLFMLIHQFY
jgi:hypothetical protein